MAKPKREKIKLESTAGTGYFYTTTKNRRTSTGKLELMKYDPKVLTLVAASPVILSAPLFLFGVWDAIEGPGF